MHAWGHLLIDRRSAAMRIFDLWIEGRLKIEFRREEAMDDMFEKGTAIYSRDGKLAGIVTGARYPCRLEGCSGMRISVRWPDGKHTFPCSKGIVARKGRWQIG